MTMKNILHNISDKSDAEQSNLWLAIEEQMIEEKLMKTSKKRLYRLSLTWLVALLGLLIVASIAFGQNVQRTYHPVTLADIEVLANPINMIETNDGFTIQVDWSYADTTQIIFAYTVLDENGNALIGHDIGRGELKYFGDAGNRILPLVHNPNETQQVVRISRGFLFGMDLTTIALRNFMTSFGEGSSSASILAELELPVREPLFDYDVELPEFDFTGQSSPGFTDVNVYFSDLTIDDISTTVLLCMALPDDAIPASYFPDVNLFVDGRAVTDVLITEAVPGKSVV